MIILFLINNNLYLNEEGVCVYVYRVIHERDTSEFLPAAAHYTHCNNILISNFENYYN
jgi:hypothetical protein